MAGAPFDAMAAWLLHNRPGGFASLLRRYRRAAAKACLVGRAFLYGLASGGTPGVTQALDILKDEIDSTIAHVGITDVRELAKRREEFLVSA